MMTVEDKAESVRLHLFSALEEIKEIGSLSASASGLKKREELRAHLLERIAMALLYAIDVEAFIRDFNKVGKA